MQNVKTNIVLRDYQEDCINTVIQEARKGETKQVIVLATGLGKTIIFGHLPSRVRDKGKKTLILAHREELLDQARYKLLSIDPSLKIGIEQAGRESEPSDDVIIASVPTLGRQGSIRIEKFNPEEFGLIIIDECHHATTESYKRILEYFDVLKGEVKKPNGRVLLGVTATPNRADHTGLDNIFNKISFTYTLRQGIENNYLSNIKAYSVSTASDLSRVHTRGGDFVDKELGDAVNTDERNQLLVESYREIAPDSKALVFCVNVEHTEEVCEYFKQAGHKAEFILGTTDKDERKEILRKFKTGEVKVLCNCAVLTEGFDEPSIETILMARPTKSSVMYSQMVGRGTRLNKGKAHLTLIDFVDNTGNNKIVTLPNLFGLNATLKGGKKGRYIMETVQKAEKVLDVCPDYNLELIDDWEDSTIEKIIKEVDIFAKAQLPKEVTENSRYAWEQAGEGHYRLQFPIENERKEVLEIEIDMLNKYTVTKRSFHPTTPSYQNGWSKWRKGEVKTIGTYSDIVEALRGGDEWLETYKGHLRTMFSQDSKWRKDTPTEKQLELLKKLRIPTPKGLTKGQASVLIGKALNERKSRKF